MQGGRRLHTAVQNPASSSCRWGPVVGVAGTQNHSEGREEVPGWAASPWVPLQASTCGLLHNFRVHRTSIRGSEQITVLHGNGLWLLCTSLELRFTHLKSCTQSYQIKMVLIMKNPQLKPASEINTTPKKHSTNMTDLNAQKMNTQTITKNQNPSNKAKAKDKNKQGISRGERRLKKCILRVQM